MSSHHVLVPRFPPLPASTSPSAVADVWQLLPARAGLEADLGPAAAARVEALSAAYSEWCLDAADRSCVVGTGSYAAAVQLPVGEDLQMDIQPPSYRPRCAAGGLPLGWPGWQKDCPWM